MGLSRHFIRAFTMLQITPKHKIYLGIAPIDFRKGIDGIVAICRRQLQLDPLSGHCFIFRNRKGNALKLLLYDSQGFWLCHKRLSAGRFTHWPKASQAVLSLDVPQLQALLYQGDPACVQAAPAWQEI